MTAINLDNLQGIPEEFLNELKLHKSLFVENLFFDDLIDNSSINELVGRINDYCLKKQIIGFHYTRANRSEIMMNGLVCRTGKEIRNSFMSKYYQIFTEEETITIIKAWNDHFSAQQQKSRDNYLFFNFTTCALNHGAEPLLSNFGGEQVYMPLQDLAVIGKKIKQIGEPLIVKCKLSPNNINTFYQHPWGRIAVSKYHCQLNPEALQVDQDGYQKVDVKPEDIELIDYRPLQNKR